MQAVPLNAAGEAKRSGLVARVTHARSRPGQADQFIRLVQEALLPAAREQRGFRGFLLLTDRAAGKHLGLSLWETEEDLTTSEGATGYYQEQMAQLADLQVQPPVREVYEVSCFDRPELPR